MSQTRFAALGHQMELMHVLWTILRQSAIQFALLFGIVILAGSALTLISKWTTNACRQFLYPNFGTYVFGLIGVPVHEFSHAFFCKVFGHQIRDVKWFDPAAHDGAHGAVTHEYNPWNLYHRVGHFFIGFGPVILAPIILGVLFYFLVPGSKHLVHPSTLASTHPWALVYGFLTTLFSVKAMKSVGFWVFAYLGLCISSQMELSREDLKQATTGILPIGIALFIINCLSWLFGFTWHSHLSKAGNLIWSMGLGLFALTAALAVLNLLLCTFTFTLVNRICGREFINPFK